MGQGTVEIKSQRGRIVDAIFCVSDPIQQFIVNALVWSQTQNIAISA